MPPQQRARKTAAAPPDPSESTPAPAQAVAATDTSAEAVQEPDPICPACFLGGWNALPADAATAGCEHGTYRR